MWHMRLTSVRSGPPVRWEASLLLWCHLFCSLCYCVLLRQAETHSETSGHACQNVMLSQDKNQPAAGLRRGWFRLRPSSPPVELQASRPVCKQTLASVAVQSIPACACETKAHCAGFLQASNPHTRTQAEGRKPACASLAPPRLVRRGPLQRGRRLACKARQR